MFMGLPPWLAVPVGGLAVVIWFACAPIQRWRLRHIPGPVGLPLIGNLLGIMRQGMPHYADSCSQKFGHVFKFWFGSRPFIVVTDPAAGRRVLSRLNQRPSLLRQVTALPEHQHRVAMASMIVLTGAPWRVARKAFESAVMHRSALDLHMEVMQECVDRLVSRVGRLVADAPGGEINMSPLLSALTMDAVGSCAFGVAFNTQEDEHQGITLPAQGMPYTGPELIRACRDVIDFTGMDRASKWVRLAAMFPSAHGLIRILANTFPDAAQTRSVQGREVMQEMAKALIRMYETGGDHAKSAFSQRSFLGMLLSGQDLTTGTKLSEDEVVAQAMTFLLAGFETTAATLMFSVYLLALHPEAQSRLHQELDQGREVLARRVVHAGSGATVNKAGGGAVAAAPAGPMDMNGAANGSHSATAAARGDEEKPSSVAGGGSNEAGLNNEEIAKHFPYACAVIDEALRLFPPGAGPVTSRMPQEDMEVLGYRIPKGSYIWVPVWSLHHDESQWPRASEFLPDRFLPGHEDIGPPAAMANAYAPFGQGARACAGLRFALQEARLALVRLFDRFRFELGPSQEVPIKTRVGVTIGPLYGVHVKVYERHPAH